MNAKLAAEKWNVHLGTVYSYLRDGYVTNAYKNENGHWVIDDKALRPYIIKSRGFLSEEKIYEHILKALNLRQSISSNQIPDDLQDYFMVLHDSGNILKLKKEVDDLFRQYKITQKGLETLKSPVKLIELVKLGLEIFSLL